MNTAEQWSLIFIGIFVLSYLIFKWLNYIDSKRASKYDFYCDEDDPFYCQNCGFSYEDTEETCPYH